MDIEECAARLPSPPGPSLADSADWDWRTRRTREADLADLADCSGGLGGLGGQRTVGLTDSGGLWPVLVDAGGPTGELGGFRRPGPVRNRECHNQFSQSVPCHSPRES
eukprot:gene12102-biopygen2181